MNTKAIPYFRRAWRGHATAAMLIVLFGTTAPLSHASFVVAPNANQNVDGNGNNVAPFSAGLFGTGPTERYQQVYAASQFAAVGPTFTIGTIAFRADSIDGAGAFSDTYETIQIDLSTTSLGPNALSSTFANNVGADDHVVYSGSLTLSGSSLGQSPNPFNLIITLQTPFLYAPSLGNLLLDIRISESGQGFMPALDATIGSSATSRVRSFNDVGSLTGTADGDGLVTEFGPVPEPSALTLCVCGIALLGLGRLFRQYTWRSTSNSCVLRGIRSL